METKFCCPVNVPLDASALAEAVAKFVPSAGPLNFITPVTGLKEPPEDEGTPAFDVADESAKAPCCPYGGKYVGAGVDIIGC